MILHEIDLFGYRGFSKAQKLSFAVPNGQPGSGLTVIVGPNNAGKSSIVEALAFLRAPGQPVVLTEGQKNSVSNGKVEVKYATDKGQYRLSTGTGGAATWSEEGKEKEAGMVFVVPSRRGIESQFQLSGQSRSHYVQHSNDFTSRRPISPAFAERLTAIDGNKEPFRDLLLRVLPDAPDWYLEKADQGHHFVKVTSGVSPHSSDGFGQGILAVFHIVDALYDSKPGEVIVFDEPELSLHPAAQRRLCKVFAEYSAKCQIIVSTHSPYFLAPDLLAAGAIVARVSTNKHGARINQLTKATTSRLLSLLPDMNNPHVLGLDAREVFFLEDNVLLVEGQEDVGGYQAVFEQIGKTPNASFFGWGVGGAAKMPTIATVLYELGVAKVVGLLDAGQEQLATTMQQQFPTYRFFTIPAGDIRDKRARKGTPERRGLLASNGEIHAEYLAQTHQTVDEVIAYLVSQSGRQMDVQSGANQT